jgi:hypothetical protein
MWLNSNSNDEKRATHYFARVYGTNSGSLSHIVQAIDADLRRALES